MQSAIVTDKDSVFIDTLNHRTEERGVTKKEGADKVTIRQIFFTYPPRKSF